MKNYLIRAGQSPFDMLSVEDVVVRNSIGENSGNLLYAQSVFRTLMVDDTTSLIANNYRYTPFDPAQVNEHFDAFVVPLADAFRPNFPELPYLTDFIEQLTIPCVVIGVGLRAPFDYTPEKHFAFDNDVKRFVKAVLKRSAKIGVRGEITSSYLTSLGFKEGRDHMVIGCPSMYTFGRELKVKDVPQSYDARVCVNATATSNITRANDFIFREAQKFSDYHFLPQLHSEYALHYAGLPYKHKKVGYYPDSLLSKELREHRVHTFGSAREWLDFTGTMDFSFGGRLHGNIGAILGGTPGLLFTKDARTRELADYHKLPSMPEVDITEDDTIFDLIEKADFTTYKKVHPDNFDRYCDFLDANGLDHIYKHDYADGAVPFDAKMEKSYKPKHMPSALSFNEVDVSERMQIVIDREYPNAAAKARAVVMAYGLKRYTVAEKEIAQKVIEENRVWGNLQTEFAIVRQRYLENMKHGVAQDTEVHEMGIVANKQIASKKKIDELYNEILESSKLYFRIVDMGGILARKQESKRFVKDVLKRETL